MPSSSLFKSKFIFAFWSFFSFIIIAQAQVVKTFKEFDPEDTRLDSLDAVYKSAIHVDSNLAVFKTAEEQILMMNAYNQLFQELNNYLFQHGFSWEYDVRCFNRVYFNREGKVDYFIYNFLEFNDQYPKEEKEEQFKILLLEFLKDYIFEMTAESRFSQCAPVVFQASK